MECVNFRRVIDGWSTVYEYDSMVWCVRCSGPIATWKNIYKLFRDWRLVFPIYFSLFCYMIVLYFNCILEDVDWDFYEAVLTALLISINMPSQLTVNSLFRRILYSICGLLPGMIVYITLVSFYIAAISKQFYEPQINSWNDIEKKEFKLMVDQDTGRYFDRSQMVILNHSMYLHVNQMQINCSFELLLIAALI